MSDEMRRAAVDSLRYNHGGLLMGQAGVPAINPGRGHQLSELEIAQIEAEQRRWAIKSNRQQALGHTLALGRRYDSAADAIDDARVIASFLQLEID